MSFWPGIVLKGLGVIIAPSVCFLAPAVDRAKRQVCVRTRVHTSTHVGMVSAHWRVPSRRASVSSFPKLLYFLLVCPFSSGEHVPSSVAATLCTQLCDLAPYLGTIAANPPQHLTQHLLSTK